MEKAFWLDKWQRNEIGFHNSEAHPLLVKHFASLGLAPGARLFLPLCGKTLDICWLLAQGYRVAGAELSEMAVQQLFEELALTPEITEEGQLKRYSAAGLDIFVGDFFHLTWEALGKVDAVYDRAALVALPHRMRIEYAKHLGKLTGCAPQLLISFDYDQSQLPGPPFCVDDDEVQGLYSGEYNLELIDAVDVEGGLKGKVAALEKVWLLQPHVS
ncbi:thiopurine S-methyltransferase [Microbulbifer bruguierae]|uniref:Thiopurine S-methyltransferase n=1 Tax=Microbulbifer bruguierae TaxID=3029061 RepID=A0ABY8NGV3_9GAMM|nr:thiopurine S-methyltransferase [Microbulbifer bruguierae]WGL16952.1 thiopurine S-methyltransferase [Microbulbifer bruguierae]